MVCGKGMVGGGRSGRGLWVSGLVIGVFGRIGGCGVVLAGWIVMMMVMIEAETGVGYPFRI